MLTFLQKIYINHQLHTNSIHIIKITNNKFTSKKLPCTITTDTSGICTEWATIIYLLCDSLKKNSSARILQ